MNHKITVVQDTLNKSMNNELRKIDDWMKINKLSINYNKTKFMIISSKKTLHNVKISIGKHKIEEVSEIKHLGITFDNKLFWKPHIQHTYTKLASGSWALLNIRNYVDISTLKMHVVYYNLIHSHLQYCIDT